MMSNVKRSYYSSVWSTREFVVSSYNDSALRSCTRFRVYVIAVEFYL